MTQKIKAALAGNPNSGKTSIFNFLTGGRQHVGNYPGVTVEKRDGEVTWQGRKVTLSDLPGIYSLTAYSIEEVLARDALAHDGFDVVIDVIDASNLERNLYLTVQLLEMGLPLVMVFNMSDLAARRGLKFDEAQLSKYFGAPIVPAVGHKGKGGPEILKAVTDVVDGRFDHERPIIHYGKEVECVISEITDLLTEKQIAHLGLPARWVALKLLEGDKDLRERLAAPEIDEAVERGARHIESILGDPPEILIADSRYGFISGACQETVKRTVEARHNASDKIDAIVTNRALAFPIFFGFMYLTFQLTFTLGEPFMVGIENGFAWLAGGLSSLWPKGSDSFLRSLLVDGIIGGVGGVLVFLPNIVLLFMAISFLEDSGYMARAAFIMDRLMHKIGLHGKSFIPMLIGFGCSVPAIMATRTLENRRDRLTTMLVIPLMSCGARLTIYAMIIPAFFPMAWRAPMLWIIYVIGIILAVIVALFLRKTLFKGLSEPFVMELPPYRLPTLRGVVVHMWERSWLYMKKAGTLILGASIILWALSMYPQKRVFDQDYAGEAIRARTAFVQGVRDLNTELGLPAESDLLSEAVEADLEWRAAQDAWYAHEKEYQAAQTAWQTTIDELAQTTDGAVLHDLRPMIDYLDEAYANHAEALAKAEEAGDEPMMVALNLKWTQTMDEARKTSPVLLKAAEQYIADYRTPFEERLIHLEEEKQAEAMAYSITGRIGQALEPVIRPCGFDWRIGTALVGAFAAKEVFVAQMGIVFAVGDEVEATERLRSRLVEEYTPLIGFCVMLFCLIGMPCVATMAATRRESGAWKWVALQAGGLTVLAWIVTAIVFQAGTFMGL